MPGAKIYGWSRSGIVMNFSAVLITISFLSLLVSFWNRNDLPANIDYLPDIDEEPRQSKTRKKAFDVNYNGVAYRVQPEYEYELFGMIVSYRHHDGQSRMHRRSGDHLNMLDVCVIWGDNAANRQLGKISFWNGIFTCNVQTRDRAAWEAFDMYQLSNNHLISADDRIRDKVADIRVGDQIRVRGQLASYTGPVGTRGTSTTRMDTGDGACETIFVEDFAIVRSALSYWRWSMYLSLAVLLASLTVYLKSPYRPFRNR